MRECMYQVFYPLFTMNRWMETNCLQEWRNVYSIHLFSGCIRCSSDQMFPLITQTKWLDQFHQCDVAHNVLRRPWMHFSSSSNPQMWPDAVTGQKGALVECTNKLQYNKDLCLCLYKMLAHAKGLTNTGNSEQLCLCYCSSGLETKNTACGFNKSCVNIIVCLRNSTV